MIDKTFIEKRIGRIEAYSREIEMVFKYSLEEIKKDFLKYRTIERLLQLLVDEMIDVNNHFIGRLNFKIPDDFQSTFLVLGENNILPEDFAKRLAPLVGLRNRLVRRYEEIDLGLLLNTVQKEKGDFKKYIKFIREYIEKKS
jgi:uncharacterized protein YutE (UPF0331/DUF86 family)